MKQYVYQIPIDDDFCTKYNIPHTPKEFQKKINELFGIKFVGVGYSYLRTHFFQGDLQKLKAFVKAVNKEWNTNQLYETVTIDSSFNRDTPLETICHSIAEQLDKILAGKTKLDGKKSTFNKCTEEEREAAFYNKILKALFLEEDLRRIGFYIHEQCEICYFFPEPPIPTWHIVKLPFHIFLSMSPGPKNGHYLINGITYVLGKETFNWRPGNDLYHIYCGTGFNSLYQAARYSKKTTSTMTGRDFLLAPLIRDARREVRQNMGQLNYHKKLGDDEKVSYYAKSLEFAQEKLDKVNSLKTLEIDPSLGPFDW